MSDIENKQAEREPITGGADKHDGQTSPERPSTSSGTGQRTKKKLSVQIKEPPPSERCYRSYSVQKVEEKHGLLHKAIPCMPLGLAILCCILNTIAPGVGTLISSFSVFCCGTTRVAKPLHAFGLNVASALLQMITFIIIIGWIWSILWGMTMIQLALRSQEKTSSPVPYYVRRQSSLE